LFFHYLKNTLSGYCPNCGQDKIFFSWVKMKDKCNRCGIWFIEKNGDNWFFLLFIDRGLFIFPIIVGYFFDLKPENLIFLSIFILLAFIIATPLRLGLSLAFEYFIRTKINKNN